MTKLTLEQVYDQIPERFKNEIEIIEYYYHNKMIIKTRYGLSRMSLHNLQQLENFSIRSALNKTEFFKNMLLEKYPEYEKEYTIIGEFTRSNEGILVQGKYDTHLIKPDTLLSGALPHIKNAQNSTKYYINLFNDLHNNRYTYPNYEYCGSSCMVKILCDKHGEFEQKNYIHAMKSGCTACADENKCKGHSRTDFIRNAKGRECILYIVKMSNKTEKFYKIGITSHPTEYRFKKASDVKYNIEIIHEYKSFDAGYIWDLEKEHHRKYKEFHYKPEIYFKGITECFTTELPIEEIITYLEQL